MTISTRMLGLIMSAVLLGGDTRAEDLPLPGAGDPMDPSDLSLPAFEVEGEPGVSAPQADDESMLSGRGPIGVDSLDGYEEPAGPGFESYLPEHHGLWMNESAPIESTGTWLRRGFWYAEAEAVVWNRHWNRDNKWFAAQDPDVNSPTFFFNVIGLLNTNRLLIVDGAQPGEDASVRGTLGHFLFRDAHNRDHTGEFTVFGSGDWHQHRRISSSTPFQLFVPFVIDGANRSFDSSSTQIIDYSSTFRSFEANYRVKERLRRDQMIMDANGNWHRAANPGWNREYLVGLRYMDLRDIFDWRAEDILQLGDDGSYLIRTQNDMFGFQMGAGFSYERARWSLGLQSKAGVFLNNAVGRTTLDFTADDLNDADLRLQNDELSFIGEAKLVARWHILADFSLRAAYEMMYLTSQALAPNQTTFITDFSYLNTTQDPFYHGASFGLEGYW
jgi:Putative beta barrel porin-7 (BBP7)